MQTKTISEKEIQWIHNICQATIQKRDRREVTKILKERPQTQICVEIEQRVRNSQKNRKFLSTLLGNTEEILQNSRGHICQEELVRLLDRCRKRAKANYRGGALPKEILELLAYAKPGAETKAA